MSPDTSHPAVDHSTSEARNFFRFAPAIARALQIYPSPSFVKSHPLQPQTYIARLREAVRFAKRNPSFLELCSPRIPLEIFLSTWPRIKASVAPEPYTVRLGPLIPRRGGEVSTAAIPAPSPVTPSLGALRPTSLEAVRALVLLIEENVLPPTLVDLPDPKLQVALAELEEIHDIYLQSLSPSEFMIS
jgi:hypothetical protein